MQLAIIITQKVTHVASHYLHYLRQGGNVFAGFCLSVSQQDNSKSYGWIFLKF